VLVGIVPREIANYTVDPLSIIDDLVIPVVQQPYRNSQRLKHGGPTSSMHCCSVRCLPAAYCSPASVMLRCFSRCIDPRLTNSWYAALCDTTASTASDPSAAAAGRRAGAGTLRERLVRPVHETDRCPRAKGVICRPAGPQHGTAWHSKTQHTRQSRHKTQQA
jgi:hypothetical protein